MIKTYQKNQKSNGKNYCYEVAGFAIQADGPIAEFMKAEALELGLPNNAYLKHVLMDRMIKAQKAAAARQARKVS